MKIYQLLVGCQAITLLHLFMRTAFITGATSGIGKATATRLAGENYRLILCGRRKEILEELAGELAQKTDVYTLTFDVRNYEEVQNAVASLPA